MPMTFYVVSGPPGSRRLEAAEPGHPAALGPRQVLISMKAWSINYRDLMVSEGTYDPKESRTLIPLSDGAGEVTAVGPEVARFKPGDRVAASFFQTWTDGPYKGEYAASALGGAADGVFAPEVVLEESGLVKIPDSLTWEEAAAFPCAGVTAWNALFGRGRLLPGQTVLLLGTGGVSMFALQLAKAAGARVIITSSKDEKLDHARQLGADLTINYREHPDWHKEVFRLTDRQLVDHVVEVGGAGTLEKSLRSVKPGGTVSVIGVLDGAVAALNTGLIFHKSLQLNGIYVGSRKCLEQVLEAYDQGQMKPVIHQVLSPSNLPDAFQIMRDQAHLGKIVLSVSA